MADLADVANEMVSAITAAIYPNGATNPSVMLDAHGAPIPAKIGRGWPLKNTLGGIEGNGGDLGAGVVNVSVIPISGGTRNTTRFEKRWRPLVAPNPTVTLTVSGNQVTVGGTVINPENLGIVVDNTIYLYAGSPSDTLSSIAASMAALIPGATASGPIITLHDNIGLQVATGGAGTMFREIARQEQLFDVGLWCNSPAQRDACAPFVDVIFKSVEFIPLADGTSGRILFARQTDIDGQMLENLYRRHLVYSVEYATIQTSTAYQIVAIAASVAGGALGTTDPNAPVAVLNI